MKLIDLLVQELPKRGGWPEGVHSITQDDDGSLFLWAISGAYPKNNSWRHSSGCGLLGYWYGDRAFKSADDRNSAYISAEQYEAALAASKQAAWNGEGLPPIGCECEAYDGAAWYPAVVVDHYDGFAFLWNYDHRITFTVNEIDSHNLRLIRTEEERKRDKFAKSLCDHLDDLTEWDSPVGKVHALAIYDAIDAGKIPGVKLED